MNWNTLKKYLGWKTLLILSCVTLVAACTAEMNTLTETSMALYAIVIGFLAIICSFTSQAGEAQTVADITPPAATNAAVFSVNWTKTADTTQQGGNYQLSLPFSDYLRTGKTVKPDNHFHLGQAFHFGMPLLSEMDEQGNLPTNIDEAKQSNIPFSLSFTPVASNQQQQVESTEWLNAEENMPLNTLGASTTNNVVRLYQPITLKRDNQIIATVNSMLIEKNQIEQGNAVNISLDGMYGPIKTNQKNANYGPGTFSFVLNNLDAKLVHQLKDEVNTLKYLPKEKQMLMQLKMLSQLKALCKKGSTLTVTYDANTPTGPVKQNYVTDLSDLIKAPTQFSGPMLIDLGLLFGDK